MKVFRKIRAELLNEGKTKRYILYAIGEILLVMIGILLAFQVDSWNDGMLRRKQELNYYKNVREQLVDDSTSIFDNWQFNNRYLRQFDFAIDIIEEDDRSQIDTLGKIMFNLTEYSDFDQQGNIYETLVTGGEIKLLKNQEIIEAIRDLERRYIYMNRMENIHWDFITQEVVPAISRNLKLSSAQVNEPEAVYSYRFQNLIFGLKTIMQEKDTIYLETNEQIRAIMSIIDLELEAK